jgi:hypothetical protein
MRCFPTSDPKVLKVEIECAQNGHFHVLLVFSFVQEANNSLISSSVWQGVQARSNLSASSSLILVETGEQVFKRFKSSIFPELTEEQVLSKCSKFSKSAFLGVQQSAEPAPRKTFG